VSAERDAIAMPTTTYCPRILRVLLATTFYVLLLANSGLAILVLLSVGTFRALGGILLTLMAGALPCVAGTGARSRTIVAGMAGLALGVIAGTGLAFAFPGSRHSHWDPTIFVYILWLAPVGAIIGEAVAWFSESRRARWMPV
jgi:hypothetical protein